MSTTTVGKRVAETAEEIIERHHNIKLSAEASARFLALLENPPKPNAALKKAWKRRRVRR